MRLFIPMVGNEYGQLKVVDRNHTYSSKNFHWNCLCTCGNVIICAGTRLRAGLILACPTCMRNKKWEEDSKAKRVQLEISGVEIDLSDKNKHDTLNYLAGLKQEHVDRLAVLEQAHEECMKDITSVLEEKKEIDENIRNIDAAAKALKQVLGL